MTRQLIAIVAAFDFYPLCHVDPMQGRPAVDLVRPDHDRTVLVLLGDQDVEASATDCQSLFEALADKGSRLSGTSTRARRTAEIAARWTITLRPTSVVSA